MTTGTLAGTTIPCHIDEDVLRAEGVTGFSGYRLGPARKTWTWISSSPIPLPARPA